MTNWTVEDALKWADSLWVDETGGREPSVGAHALAALAREVRRLQAVEAEKSQLRDAALYALHALENARVWTGQEWNYNALHPLNYRVAMERLQKVLRG